jgi:cytochrome c oxidase assembly protein Cox11
MEKDVRKTIAIYVIICFVVFSCGYSMLPVYNTIKKTNGMNNQPASKPVTKTENPAQQITH